MRRWFNNPTVIVMLCLLTVGVWILTLMPWELDHSLEPSDTASPGLFNSPIAPQRPRAVGQETRRGQGWPTAPLRDPFLRAQTSTSPRSPAATISPTATTRTTERTQGTNAPTVSFRLQAIAIEGDQKWAVVDSTVVKEGDRVQGYRVSRIQQEAIWVKGPAGSIRLDFPTAPLHKD